MPELPEVEVVRRGLAAWIVDRGVGRVEVLHPRSVRRHVPGAVDFGRRLEGRVVTGVCRRGKYLWLPLDSGEALVAHLGMSGQLLLQPGGRDAERHLRVRMALSGGERELRFVDQRTFGHLLVGPLAPDTGGGPVPEIIAHIARDPLDPAFDDAAFTAALLRRRSEVKRALLDQSLVSGVGNIYADEALWRARLSGLTPTGALRVERVAELLAAVRAVMREALEQGGTSFDSLYVDVNGQSGYFERGLNVYGRVDLPCHRCGAPIRRRAFMNRSSFTCPSCQPEPEACDA